MAVEADVTVEVVRAAHAEVRSRIDDAARRSGREPAAVEVVAAIKYVTLETLPALAEAGIRRVGENRTDQLVRKQLAHGGLFTWDFIGHLQSRKVKEIAGRTALIHALSSLSAAEQIDRRSEQPQDVLIEVNVARDPDKYGLLPEDVDAFLEQLALLERVRVRGLMTMPPFAEQAEASRPAFAALRELAAELSGRWHGAHAFGELSMGTSQDYAVAVEEGATLVRLGTLLYGR